MSESSSPVRPQAAKPEEKKPADPLESNVSSSRLLLAFYKNAKDFCVRRGYGGEIAFTDNRRFEDRTPTSFLHQYIYVVLNAGMKNQVAEGIYIAFLESGMSLTVIRHESKRRAIGLALEKYREWFEALTQAEDKLAFLETLPWIGSITKYHLARNLGIDVAKPDRHLVRLAERFGFKDVQAMCHRISQLTGDRIGVVDVVLWRASNLGLTPNSERLTSFMEESG